MRDSYWLELQRRRISRRGVLRSGAIVGVGAAGVALLGCSGSNNNAAKPPATAAAGAASATAGTAAPARSPAAAAATGSAAAVGATSGAASLDKVDLNATLKAAINGDAGNLDPQSLAGVANLPNVTTHFDFPFDFDRTTKAVIGKMVDFSWMNNNTMLQLKVHPGITFHNGEPFDANALKFSFDRCLERTDYNKGGSFKSGRKTQLASITGDVTVVDPMTVQIACKPDVTLPATIAPSIAMVPPGYVQKVGDAQFAANPIGSGPFKFTAHDPDTDYKSTRFDQYFNTRTATTVPRLPFIKDLIQIVKPDEQSRVAALQAGEVDLAWDLSPELARQFDGKKGFKVLYAADANGSAIQFATRPDKDAAGNANPWRDMRVRQACNVAVDVPTITKKLLTGTEQPCYGASSVCFGFPQELKQKTIKFNPQQAKQLLSAAGYANGITTDFYVGTGRFVNTDQVCQAVAGYLKDVGITCNLKVSSFTDELPLMTNMSLPGLFWFPSNNVLDPNSTMQAEYNDKGAYTKAVYPDTDIQKLYDGESAEFDIAKRQALLGQLYTTFYDNYSWIFLYETVRAGVLKDNLAWTPYGLPGQVVEYWNIQVIKG